MGNSLLTGLGRFMLPIPSALWRSQVAKAGGKIRNRQGFMTPEHRAVHHFVVRELPGVGEPMTPDFIAEGLDLPRERVTAILDALEKHLTYLFRNKDGAVTWAYPVTVDKTPHRMTFSTGETIYAA